MFLINPLHIPYIFLIYPLYTLHISLFPKAFLKAFLKDSVKDPPKDSLKGILKEFLVWRAQSAI